MNGADLIDAQSDLIRSWRRFGIAGPVYQVIAVGSRTANDRTMRIRVLESGEELDYPLGDVLDDPREG